MPDREKVKKALEMCIEDIECNDCPYEEECFAANDEPYAVPMMRDALELLKEQPEIVRCKDCKHGEKWNAVYACGKSRGFGTTHEPDWFCADGER
jgi:hypothetical protein